MIDQKTIDNLAEQAHKIRSIASAGAYIRTAMYVSDIQENGSLLDYTLTLFDVILDLADPLTDELFNICVK